MQQEAKEAVRQVLSEAGDAPHFFDLSDAERLSWMIARAFVLGQSQQRTARPKQRASGRKAART